VSKLQRVRNPEDVVWEAVVNQLELDPAYDHDGAVRLADHARALMQRGAQFDKAKRRDQVWGEVWAWAWRSALWIMVVAVLAAAIGTPILIGMKVRSNDYAHTDPGSVGDGAYYRIHEWYGQNDLPQGLSLRSMTHSDVDGHPAWLTRWQAASGKQVCAYVWGRSSPDHSPHQTYGKVASCP
jgi:hypothetical protein